MKTTLCGERPMLNSSDTREQIHRYVLKRALSIVLEWLDLHQAELLANWELARQRKVLNEVEPLR